MKQVIIERLSCVATEDTLGEDECRLEVYADGELHYAYRKGLNNGDSWALNASLLFATSCDLRLFDEDGDFPGDADDALGTAHIGAVPVQHAQASFVQDGASYRLDYSVVDRPDIISSDLATFALDQFELSPTPGVWPHISKPALIAELRARHADPSQVNQVRSNFCGPTSIVYEMARTQPRRYIDLCRQLYETGGFWSRTHRVETPGELRGTQVGQGMASADWMLIATMRESENALFGVSADASGVRSGLQGLTTPWEMEGWTSELLLKDNVANSTTFVWGEFDALRYAEQVWAARGNAFVMIHTDMLGAPNGIVPPWPDHWVVYQGGLDESGGRVRFAVYTWGGLQAIDTTPDHFENCMYGIVTGF